jgi:hypothetical protein
MWVVGTVVVLAIGAALAVAAGWTPRTTPSPRMWDIPKLGGGNAGNAGAFAGFSLTSAIFVAGVGDARSAPAFTTVFGMMLVGFLILVVATWISSTIPDRAKLETAISPTLLYLLGNMATNLGVAVTWLALPPLLTVVGLPSLVGVFVGWLLVMVLVAGAWSALLVYRLTPARARACLTIPVLSLALPALYRLEAVRRWPALWPARDAGLQFAFVALGAATLMYALHMGLLLAHGDENIQRRLRQSGARLALGATQAFDIVVALLWFAIVTP